jgi:hypothetical protein
LFLIFLTRAAYRMVVTVSLRKHSTAWIKRYTMHENHCKNRQNNSQYRPNIAQYGQNVTQYWQIVASGVKIVCAGVVCLYGQIKLISESKETREGDEHACTQMHTYTHINIHMYKHKHIQRLIHTHIQTHTHTHFAFI